MSLVPAVQVGTKTVQAAIDAVDDFGADSNTLSIRLSVVRLLLLQQEDMTATGEEEHLLAAYRDWLNVASRYFGSPPRSATDREYARSSAILLAELRLAGSAVSADRGDGNGRVPDQAAII
jgi:hypothetical protein